MTGRRTYWHLEGLGRRPNDYDIATSKLLYYPGRGFEVQTPIADWFEQYQTGSPLRAADWERFRDPAELTYSRYTAIQSARETFVELLFHAAEESGADARLDAGWLDSLDEILPALRFPVHGLQMIAAYVGHLAPSGRIVVACLFQAADEIRRVQRFAYRMRQLQEVRVGFGSDARARWQAEPAWQPLRRLLELLLVTWDWGEALVALELVVKPTFDELFGPELARVATARGDDLLAKVLFSLGEDARRHRDWSAALVRLALADGTDRGVVTGWIERWRPLADEAVAALAPLFERAEAGAGARARAAAAHAREVACAAAGLAGRGAA